MQLNLGVANLTRLCQEKWGEALRTAPRLRVLTLPGECVGDGSAFEVRYDDDNDNDNDSHTDEDDTDDEYAPMGQALHPNIPVAGPSLIPFQSSYPSSYEERLPSWLRPFYLPLSIVAEDFADIHLRKPDFKELRFIYNASPKSPRSAFRQCRLVRFAQIKDPGPSTDRVQYMMKYFGDTDESGLEDDAFFWLPRELRRW